jgi:Protein of unknown function (DUF4231)
MGNENNSEINIAEKIKSLRKSIEDEIKTLTIKGRKNKYGATVAQSCIIIFSVATPILIGWEPEYAILKNLSLICSAITAGGTMIYNFFSYRDLWIEYKISRNDFITLLAEVDYLESSGIKNIKKEEVDRLFEKYIQIRLETGKNYRRIRSDKDISSSSSKLEIETKS